MRKRSALVTLQKKSAWDGKGVEDIEETGNHSEGPTSKKPKRAGREQFRNLKLCPMCNFTIRDHLARHIPRWHNLKVETARKLAEKSFKDKG